MSKISTKSMITNGNDRKVMTWNEKSMIMKMIMKIDNVKNQYY